ncbi:hypothetical protein Taro_005085 [Colocasia esculenta]|uniref:Uncharacterized protein n=1 Tax=Colocasia esculenta TaxID=4460 RepID=A0A843TTM0_COLES|nr:hypothetical protein [Colocasia esculenta]
MVSPLPFKPSFHPKKAAITAQPNPTSQYISTPPNPPCLLLLLLLLSLSLAVSVCSRPLCTVSDMNNLVEGSPYGFCYFHPREVVVGVCAACLTEKLLVLASKQGHGATLVRDAHHQYGSSCAFTRVPSRKPSIAMPKVFALGSSLLHRLDSRHHRRPGYDSDDGSVLSLDDSFISIKFEDNGQFCWDKKAANYNPKPAGAKPPGPHPGQNQPPKPAAAAAARSVVEHARPRGGGGGIRWRKRIGHLFQLVRWRRSSKAGAGVCHAGFSGKVEGGERRGWIRSLTRRRATE